MVEEKVLDAAFYFDMSACRPLTTAQWRAMQVATALSIYAATEPSRLCDDIDVPKSKSSATDHERGFNRAHLQQFPWLAYSHAEDGVYCRMCCIFLSRAPSAQPVPGTLFIKSAHKNWKNCLRDYKVHMVTDYHKRAVACHALVSQLPRAESTLEQALRRQAEEAVVANRARFLAVVRPLHFLAEQGLAIRGHRGESMAALTSAVHARQQATSSSVSSNRAGSKSNIIADRADLLLNLRTYDRNVRSRIIAAIERMVNAECVASGSPQPPEFAYYDQYPLTENDAEVTAVVTAAFQQHFGVDWVFDLGRLTASEDFSHLPDALGTPYTFWGLGGTDPELYAQAAKAGRIAEDIPVNHSKYYAPVLEPTLDHGTQAMVVAAMAWLGHEALKPVSR